MITFSNISKQYGKQLVFVDASFQLNPGEKCGLVGPNGAGKTTLFRMIVGEEAPDDGNVTVPKKTTIGYFRQDVEEMAGRPVLDEAIAGSGRVGDLHHELDGLQKALEDPERFDEMDQILERFGEVQEEYEHLGGYQIEAQAREVLAGLGFSDSQIDGDVGALSGGWKMRVALARVLLGRPDVLLMDEPTNHLDIESIIWLENFLRGYQGEVRLGASLSMGYFAQQSLDVLNPELTVIDQLQNDFPQDGIGSLRSLAGAFQFSGDDVEKKVRSLSGGERSRLAMARMLYNPPNFLVLDEPTNHLDLATKEMLVEQLKNFEGTMVFVSHDRTFLRGLGTRVLELSGGDSEPNIYLGPYTEYVAARGQEAPGIHA